MSQLSNEYYSLSRAINYGWLIVWSSKTSQRISTMALWKNIARIAKAASHKLPGNSRLNVSFLCPVCPTLFVQHVTFYLSEMVI